MVFRELGRTKLRVSGLALGTVALGTPYGFESQAGPRQPTADAAIGLLRHAVSSGITLFDTAPTYGTAESLVGAALSGDDRAIIATKVTVPLSGDDAALRRSIRESIERSRSELGRDVLDIVQIHNATPATLAQAAVTGELREARERGIIRFLGASVYTPDEAIVAIATGWVDMLQVPFNLLDQRVAARVLDEAKNAGVGVLTRSALLKGALSERATTMPAGLEGLRIGAERARVALKTTWRELPEAALRFCLSDERVSSVLIGASNVAELDQALAAAKAAPFTPEVRAVAGGLALSDERLIDPRLWPAT